MRDLDRCDDDLEKNELMNSSEYLVQICDTLGDVLADAVLICES